LVDSFIQKLDSDTSKFNTLLALKQQQFNEIEEKGKKQTPSTSRNVFKKGLLIYTYNCGETPRLGVQPVWLNQKMIFVRESGDCKWTF